MLSNKYSYLVNCCDSYHKSIGHVCKINPGQKMQDMSNDMNVKLITGATSGDLNFVTQSSFCSRKQYYQTIVNRKQECRAQIPCCDTLCPVYNVYEDQNYIGNVRPAGCFFCKHLQIRNSAQNPVYSVHKKCLSFCPVVFKIKNEQGNQVGAITQSGYSCPSLFQCFNQTEVDLPQVSDTDKRLLLSSIPFRI